MTCATRRAAFAGGAALGTALAAAPARAQKPFNLPASLVEAAKKEGRMTYYTAAFAEVEQETINLFNKAFPFVKIEMVRCPRRPAHHLA